MAGAMTSPQTHLYEARLRSALCVYSMVVPIVRCESPIRFRQTPSVFHRVQNEPLTVVAMRVCNPDRSPASMIPLPKCPCFGTILVMNTFNLFPPHKETERPQTNRPDSSFVPGPSDRAFVPTQSGAVLSRGVSIKGSVKFLQRAVHRWRGGGHNRFPRNAHDRGARAHTR